jgi:hypothetical protein
MKIGPAALLWFVIFAVNSPVASAQAAPQWRTYRSPYYGFTLRYPSTFAFYTGHPDFEETQMSMFPICDTTTVACVEYSFGAKAHSAIGLSVNILRDQKTEAACNQPNRKGDPALKPVTINGIAFRTGETDSVGLGSSSGGDIYRVFHQNVCFEVAVMSAGTNGGDGEDNESRVAATRFRRISDALDRVLESFAFTGPIVDGPHWNVFRDGGCGTTFEYPDSTTVDQNIPYDNASYNSQNITCSEHFLYAGRDFTVSLKDRISNPNPWLESHGYPTLASAQQLRKTTNCTEYRADPYVYFQCAGDLTLLSVSDAAHHVLSPANDPTFAHLVRTLQQ